MSRPSRSEVHTLPSTDITGIIGQIIHVRPTMQVSSCKSKLVRPSVWRLCWYAIDALAYLIKLQLFLDICDRVLGPLLHAEQTLQGLTRFWYIEFSELSSALLFSSIPSDPVLDEIAVMYPQFTYLLLLFIQNIFPIMRKYSYEQLQ